MFVGPTYSILKSSFSPKYFSPLYFSEIGILVSIKVLSIQATSLCATTFSIYEAMFSYVLLSSSSEKLFENVWDVLQKNTVAANKIAINIIAITTFI
ncbi:MAG: hypothetical protein APG08_01061 [Candidatus Methanofastidiosum methylothiophilum]|uniref:Uncharacterized protein n=1 Tax=Candidatus Methanofastidiosum methylothiophilum TaxID=1705564 RepID=A0A150JG10_9EURY|nr:MAG: hypothetical protein AN188_01424 [Candidatus Methanofastidiosum methylthiophilus]KYC56146.1 MAG: hypothetical protein APG09_01468 [Candidatus Methanofastidiosum methylthiophilus]KYC56211.1 MAG: hypothetical protein APG08_01061 [Candidatus Methanofastidiosum methylthiophilus]OQC51219.1 MAG: hypothetical protein BWX56_01084 [Euryarchaeota archaeon ADurb.Bin023]